MHSMTYGELPTFEQYDAAWDALEADDELRGGKFHFGNDPRIGTDALNKFELWEEIGKASEEYQELLSGDTDVDPEIVGNWLSCVLDRLGFEWI